MASLMSKIKKKKKKKKKNQQRFENANAVYNFDGIGLAPIV